MPQKKINAYIHSINESNSTIVQKVETLSEDIIRWNPSEDEWSILQILSHLNEATPYWLNEIDRVLAEPGTQWGRGLQHEGRLAAVNNPENMNVDIVIEEFKELNEIVAKRLGRIDESRLDEENPHRNYQKFGDKPVSFIIEHFIDEHTAKHVNQIDRNLSKLKNTSV